MPSSAPPTDLRLLPLLRDHARQADVVGAARQSLADPDWFANVLEGQGTQVRRCKYTNYCEALYQKKRQVTCQLWDREDLGGPDVMLSEGRRRLTAPPRR